MVKDSTQQGSVMPAEVMDEDDVQGPQQPHSRPPAPSDAPSAAPQAGTNGLPAPTGGLPDDEQQQQQQQGQEELEGEAMADSAEAEQLSKAQAGMNPPAAGNDAQRYKIKGWACQGQVVLCWQFACAAS